MKNELSEQIKSCAILTFSIIVLSNILIVSGKNKDKNEKEYIVGESYYASSNSLKESYTEYEFNSLLKNGEAKVINANGISRYYINTHTKGNVNFATINGYELWQEFIPTKNIIDKTVYKGLNSYLSVKVDSKKLLRTK